MDEMAAAGQRLSSALIVPVAKPGRLFSPPGPRKRPSPSERNAHHPGAQVAVALENARLCALRS
jgi:hypothetical protein